MDTNEVVYTPEIGDDITVIRPSLNGGHWTGKILDIHIPPVWTRQRTIGGGSRYMIMALVEIPESGNTPNLYMVAGYSPDVTDPADARWVWLSGLPRQEK